MCSYYFRYIDVPFPNLYRNLKLGMITLENEIGLDNEENEIGLDNVMTNEDNEIYYDNFMEKANDIMARIKDQLAK